ncbi:uncharacterized protein LOC131952580 [Physella acuta]|uniref:uncharacterized protein LOC131952580 n=1 Tax=Physella acuta TaxID=109671 RepID=UPI0027DDA454|nr:uncharacterized protein LOC131952580 [Physella acuta]
MFRSLVILVLVLPELTIGQILTANCGQLEPKSDGEVEFFEQKDYEFDQTLLSSEARPLQQPVQSKVASLYYDQYKRGTIATVEEPLAGCQGNGSGFTRLAEVNLYVRYFQFADWAAKILKCCPAYQNFGCRSVYAPIGCGYYEVHGMKAWCCPLQWINIAQYCNCRKCAIICPDCFYTGVCLRRFTYTKFAAVCYINWWWTTIVHFARYLPTSCYCRQV